MSYAVITNWDAVTGRVTSVLPGYSTAEQAAAEAAKRDKAIVVEAPAEPNAGRWFLDLSATPVTVEFRAKPASEAAQGVSLRRVDFLTSLASKLNRSPRGLVAYLTGEIEAATATLSEAEIEAACFLIEEGQTFYRQDPDPAKAALLMKAAAVLGLVGSDVDDVFLNG